MSKQIQYLTQISNYLNVPVGKITLDAFSVPIRSHNNKSVKGFFNVLRAYVNESNYEYLGKTLEDQAEVYQWIEFANVFLIPANLAQIIADCLPDLNAILAKKTYLVSNKLTIADVVIYYTLLVVMETISPIEKEKFVNICRWFDNLQQDKILRQKNSIINFNSSFLCTIAPARH